MCNHGRVHGVTTEHSTYTCKEALSRIMATKSKILLWGIFIAGFIWNGNGESPDIHDGTVHTEREKTLISGSFGILTCRFTGSPYAVFWKKGHDIWTSPTLIKWTPEEKTTGPRYDDGSCDMDKNYSLIIKSVNHADEGRFICLVSNEDGILVDDYTDVTVTDDALEMESSVTLPMKQTGFVPCQVNIRPRHVSWFGIKNETLVFIDLSKDSVVRGGTGYKDGLFNITDEYSLVIYNVKIQQEGLYFCVVTDYDTGVTYQDNTLLTVIAHPIKPFPGIQGCSGTKDHGNCILTVHSTVEITCNANRYYPDIGLYFTIGPEKIESLDTQTWINTDGTINKSVTIVGHLNNEVYICVATGIPGVNGNRSTSVRLIGQNASLNPAAIIVPIVLTLLITTGILIMTVFYRRRKTFKEKDRVSYVELWKLVELAFKNGETGKLDNVVTVLCNVERDSPGVVKDAHYYYAHLCTWKETTKQKRQRKVLKEKLQSKSVEQTLRDLRDYRKMKSTWRVIEWFDLKHVLNEIGEREEIAKFLETLGIDPQIAKGKAETSPKTFIRQAVGILQAWTTESHSINPVIILSSLLEKLNHDSAKDFFLVPDDKKDRLRERETKIFSDCFSRKHVHMISTIIQNVRGNTKPLHSMQLLRENCEILFNTGNMIRDWWEEQLGSYYRRRCILQDAINVHSIQINATKYNKPTSSQACPVPDQWPSNDELNLIADHIDNIYIEHIRDRLDLINLSQNSNRNDVFDALCAWRQSMEDDFPTMYKKLLSVLKDTNVSGLLSPLKMDGIHRAEYLEIALNLLMADILPMARHLGINETKLSSYRPAFEPSHLDKGTTGLVSTLIASLDKNKQREDLSKRLKEGGFPCSIQLNIIAHQMSYGELSEIFKSPTICKTSADEEKAAPQQEPHEGDHLLPQEEIPAPDHADTATAPMKPKVTEAAESTKGYSRIKNILPYISSHQYPDTTKERKTKEGDTSLGVPTAETSSDTIIPMEPAGVQVAKASPDVKERATTSVETTFPIEPCFRKSEVSRHLSEIKKTLNLSDKDVSSSVDNNPDEFTLFKIWKEKTRFSDVSERSSVIKCLQDSGKSELARSVIEGKFVPEEIGLSFVKHIVKKVEANSRLKELAEALGMEKGFQEGQGSVDGISDTIWNRLRFTSNVYTNIAEDGSILIKMSKVVDDKSQMVESQTHIVSQADKLVEYGFLDFARELLIIYQH